MGTFDLFSPPFSWHELLAKETSPITRIEVFALAKITPVSWQHRVIFNVLHTRWTPWRVELLRIYIYTLLYIYNSEGASRQHTTQIAMQRGCTSWVLRRRSSSNIYGTAGVVPLLTSRRPCTIVFKNNGVSSNVYRRIWVNVNCTCQ